MPSSVPPLYDQVREGSARVRARERAVAWLGRPPYAITAGVGALFGVSSALVAIIERWLPSLMPLPPLTTRQMLVGIPVRAAYGAGLFLIAAVLLRFTRWAYFRARFGARAT
jgi:hypothetical protein